MGCYAASSDNLLAAFRDNIGSRIQEDFGFLNPEDGTDRLSRNVGTKLPLLAA